MQTQSRSVVEMVSFPESLFKGKQLFKGATNFWPSSSEQTQLQNDLFSSERTARAIIERFELLNIHLCRHPQEVWRILSLLEECK